MEQISIDPKPARRAFSASEIVLAWVLLALGYAFWRVSPLKYYPLGAFLWTQAVLAVTITYLYMDGHRLNLRQWVFPAVAAVLSLTYLVTDNSGIHGWTFILTACTYLVWLLRVSGNGLETPQGELMLPEVVRASIVMPFSRFFSVFGAWFQPRKQEGSKKRAGMTVLWIILGLCAAVAPVFFIILLLGYDESFNRIFDRLTEIRLGVEVTERLFCLLGAVPVAMFLFGAWMGNKEGVASDSMSNDKCSLFMSRIRFLPRALVAAFITPLLVVYGVFFFSQMPYYVSAFSGVLPDGLSYADYARNGFFQLCAVCGINAGVLLLCLTFCKRKNGFDAVRVVFVTLLALSSILLAVTALSKMLLYIGNYGLTPKRVYTSWLMLLLVCCFAAVIVRSFVTKMNLNRALFALTASFFLVLALSNPNGLIAKYNVDRYLDGTLDSVDVHAMYELGDAAVPQMYRLWKEAGDIDANVQLQANWFLDEMSRTVTAQSNRILSCSIPSLRADNALQRWSLESGKVKP